MGEWIQAPQISQGESLGAVIVASHATDNAMGDWTQIVASTSKDIVGLIFQDFQEEKDFLVQVAIGAAGSEVLIAGYIIRSASTTNGVGYLSPIYLPISIPAGTRISVRVQCSRGAQELNVRPYALYKGDWSRDQICGVRYEGSGTTADSGGTVVDPGASANTKGNYSEVIASTSFNAKGLFLSFGDRLNTAMATCWWKVDIAIGAAGSEVIIINDFPIAARAEHDTVHPKVSPFFPLGIPLGTRISARAECDITDATDRLFDISIGVIG